MPLNEQNLASAADEDLNDYEFSEIMRCCNSEAASYAWCMRVGLLPNAMHCTKCYEPMSLCYGKKAWRCYRKGKENVLCTVHEIIKFDGKNRLQVAKEY